MPDEPATDRARVLQLVTDHHLVVEEGRHLPVVEALDRELDLLASAGADAAE